MNPNVCRFVQTLRQSMVGRDDEIRTITLALLSGEHCCLIGKPGTGKSYAVNNAMAATGAKSFQLLMTPFTTPEEVFGPFRLTALQQDLYIRNLERRLCEAELAFIDEGYKASSAILNSLLTIMQEGAFDNGGTRIKCPLRTMILASNELPEPGLLDALHDRFILRRYVKPVPNHLRRQLLTGHFPPVNQVVCSIAEFDQARSDVMALQVQSDTLDAFEKLWAKLEAGGVDIGDRRAGKAMKVIRAAAYLDGASSVQVEHLECLVDVFWNSLDEISDVRAEVLRICNPDELILNEFAEEIENIRSKPPQRNDEYLAAFEKIDGMLDKCLGLKQSPKCLAIQVAAQDLRDVLTSKRSGQSIDMVRRLRETTERNRKARAIAAV